ncbi:GTP cyclohydrolase, FolE2/MptA family [Desulfolithobacter sp.]
MEHGPGLVHKPAEARPTLKKSFDDTAHIRALQHCTDVPEQRPTFDLAVTEAGITNKTVWVQLPQGRIPFLADVAVNLPPEVKGIHMSRMEEVISELYETDFSDLSQYGRALAERVLERQHGTRVRVQLRGRVPHLSKTVISGKVSVDSAEISAEIILEKDSTPLVTMGLSLRHITACPCTQLYNRELPAFPADSSLLPTHSQRSLTTIQITSRDHALSYDDLFLCLSRALHTTQDLLKRPDEAEIVYRSHAQPQFAEDTVRETARAAGTILGNRLPGDAFLVITSLSFESIHIHDVRCEIRTPMHRLTELLST